MRPESSAEWMGASGPPLGISPSHHLRTVDVCSNDGVHLIHKVPLAASKRKGFHAAAAIGSAQSRPTYIKLARSWWNISIGKPPGLAAVLSMSVGMAPTSTALATHLVPQRPMCRATSPPPVEWPTWNAFFRLKTAQIASFLMALGGCSVHCRAKFSAACFKKLVDKRLATHEYRRSPCGIWEGRRHDRSKAIVAAFFFSFSRASPIA